MRAESDTRRRIIDSAADLFHARSYGEVGVSAICEHAGELFARALDPRLPPLARLDRFVEILHAFQKARADAAGHMPGCPFGNLAMEQGTQDEILRRKVDGILRALAGHFETLVAEALERGELDARVDPAATAEAMMGYLEGIQLLAKARNDPEMIRRLGPVVKTIRVLKSG
jgi:TetR/AcrR family transcriptional repressor of nem operon